MSTQLLSVRKQVRVNLRVFDIIIGQVAQFFWLIDWMDSKTVA